MRSEHIEEVNHPKRYSGECSIDCIEVMRVIFGDKGVAEWCLMTAFKYLWRFRSKDGEQDLDKCKWYLDYSERLINEDNLIELHSRISRIYKNIVNKI